MKIGKTSSDNTKLNPEVKAGSQKDLLKTRAERLPEAIKTIEEVLEEYTGGLVGIVALSYSPDGKKVTGSRTAVIGVDGPEALIRLAFGLRQLSDTAIEGLGDILAPKALKAVLELMAEDEA